MRLESLTVELRPRSPWEAMELGTALVRRHAAVVWGAWLVFTGLVFALLNLAAWSIGHLWLAFLLMWWLRPVFDRIPLYVLSRAVFGAAPRVGETLRAQLRWGWRPMRGHLTWRRLSPMRAATLPVDLLEGADRKRLPERRRVIAGGVGGPAMLLISACALFVLSLELSLLGLTLLFVPDQMVPQIAQDLMADFGKGIPPWAQFALNLVDWLAVAFVEPFYIGAGFGLYLNRRTQLEAWDLEIAFRRMRRRLESAATTAGALLLALALLLPAAWPAQAADPDVCPDAPKPAATPAKPAAKKPADKLAKEAKAAAEAAADGDEDTRPEFDTRTLEQIFGEDTVDHRSFDRAAAKAYCDPLLRPKLTRTTWQRRDREETPKEEEPRQAPSWMKGLSALAGFLVENALWLLLGVLLVVLFVTRRRWWPWLAAATAMPEPEPPPVDTHELAEAEPLPPDVATVARRLWAEGQPRRALALLYRASVEAMVARIDAHPPPGATEADCLRLSRRLPEAEDREAFQRMVRVWQYAAYGHTLPGAEEFDTLVGTLAQRFRWAA